MSPRSSGIRRNGYDAENPTQTPDGRWIVYTGGDPADLGIFRIRPDGSDAEVLLSRADGLIKPNLITLDISAGQMYWTDYGSKTLHRANLDGSGAEQLLYGVFELPSGLALSYPPVEVRRSYLPWIQP